MKLKQKGKCMYVYFMYLLIVTFMYICTYNVYCTHIENIDSSMTIDK